MEPVGAASGAGGLACPPASGAEPEYYGGLRCQSLGVNPRGFAQGGQGGEEYPENHPAGCLVDSPPPKSLREHTHRGRISIPSGGERKYIRDA